MGHDDSMRCLPNMLLAMVMTSGLWAADESTVDDNGLSTALESAFRIAPVHWDKNVSVVEICGVADGSDESVMLWPESTGELLKMMDALKMIAIVTHVADSRSCVLHPASHTHRQMNEQELLEAGVQPDLIRFSVGTENIEDIIDDLKQALEAI